MDNVTTSMCRVGVGRIGFARVLVEVDAKKPLPSEIEVLYKNNVKEVICKKSVIVCYDWKPPVCSTCCVFGHTTLRCGKNDDVKRAESSYKPINKDLNEKGPVKSNGKTDDEGFTTVLNRKNVNVKEKVLRPNFKPNTQKANVVNNKQGGKAKPAAKFEYQPRKQDSNIKANQTEKQPEVNEINENIDAGSRKNQADQSLSKKEWSVHGEILEAMKRFANKYSILELYDENEVIDNMDPLRVNGSSSSQVEEEDVYEDDSGMAECMVSDVLKGIDRGLSTFDKQKEVRNFITNENLNVYAILETHIKTKRLQVIGDIIFGNWEWCSNMQYCDKGCRIMLGWNGDNVNMRIVHSAKQSMLCEIIYKRIVGDEPWVLLGNMNVTLAPNEHSARGLRMTNDMEEFKDYVNCIEMEDITKDFKAKMPRKESNMIWSNS
ncbi:RNA-directed DNA polymerase, eukaryota, reverse transcriptase zinc-binding domain protein [Tanacetum coccineum]